MVELPVTRRDTTVENYHGTQVADPYRWLEDEKSAETQSWVEAQHALARAHLDQLPMLGSIKERYTELYNYPKFSAPINMETAIISPKIPGCKIRQWCINKPVWTVRRAWCWTPIR
ncbi:hypothetical protein KDW_21230 [Dictyobacter vulcani]|uniref:Peptidase S9A N-terminal domain-containing protein n=1 Tax=Dictyobacter vulcani TaxID=2607529 RepID=A0A5J4KNP5_9CHLR|nr:hypothetical protein KDW_21230 [Dictyobacter vulcani]